MSSDAITFRQRSANLVMLVRSSIWLLYISGLSLLEINADPNSCYTFQHYNQLTLPNAKIIIEWIYDLIVRNLLLYITLPCSICLYLNWPFLFLNHNLCSLILCFSQKIFLFYNGIHKRGKMFNASSEIKLWSTTHTATLCRVLVHDMHSDL